ncbi:PREDICTED: protein EXORDIUM-like 4 [Nelumbo nucifera]|uniref:Protein EXORDIUM-like 4 n=1 Tax=Nelumbo nucifera TaxID=4432 RepID=A0A1U8BAW7_NELNU|nr:PREDICTED: protein EXORDIUM-like 4 [Nelumbo nucifera]
MASSIKLVLLSALAVLLLLPSSGDSVITTKGYVTDHGGPLLKGDVNLAILWYGNVGRIQQSVILKFIGSLSKCNPNLDPQVSTWWNMVESYQSAGKRRHEGEGDLKKDAPPTPIRVRIVNQTADRSYSFGKTITPHLIPDLVKKATEGASPSTVAVILTARDVSVKTLCTGKCSEHGSVGKGLSSQLYVMVGNPMDECPQDCAWPFYKSVLRPVTFSMVPPNGDVAADAMVISLAQALAGLVTNPYHNGYFLQGYRHQIEAATACPNMFGSGAFPGYTGKMRFDPRTGGCFNAHGPAGEKFLLPALWDPATSSCWTLI